MAESLQAAAITWPLARAELTFNYCFRAVAAWFATAAEFRKDVSLAEDLKAKRERAKKIIAKLHKTYPAAKCSLNFQTPFQLLIATILSAQCTDDRVNIVTADFLPNTKLQRITFTCLSLSLKRLSIRPVSIATKLNQF